MNHNALKGVNLGGWLVLEKWITPSLFEGSGATDEWGLSREAGYQEKIARHRKEFITAQDIAWIAECGFQALRVPVGHWIVDDDSPYVPGALDYLDDAFKWAEKYRLRVLIDLHTVPGLPNDWNKSQSQGSLRWPTNAADQKRSLLALEALAARYAGRDALWGIGLLNESLWEVPAGVLADYYRAGYQAVRRHCSDDVAVVFHDNWRPLEYAGILRGAEFRNTIMDSHFYQLFTDGDRALSLEGHIAKAQIEQRNIIEQVKRTTPIIIGEWCGELAGAAVVGLSSEERDRARAVYTSAQREAFSSATAWFYWTYKTENPSGWSMRHMVASGWSPASMQNV